MLIYLLKTAAWTVLLMLLIFAPAGTLAYPGGWALLIVFTLGSVAAIAWLARANPALLACLQQALPGLARLEVLLVPLEVDLTATDTGSELLQVLRSQLLLRLLVLLGGVNASHRVHRTVKDSQHVRALGGLALLDQIVMEGLTETLYEGQCGGLWHDGLPFTNVSSVFFHSPDVWEYLPAYPANVYTYTTVVYISSQILGALYSISWSGNH